MCDFETPILLWYTHIPVLIISGFLGFFILFVNKKNPVNKNLFIFILLYCFWVINTLLQWLTRDVDVSLFLQQFSIFEFFSIAFFLYFAYAFVGLDLDWKKKGLFFLPFIPAIAFIFTDYNLTIDPEACDTTTGPLYVYLAGVIFFYFIWSIFVFIRKYKQTSDEKIKNQIKIVIGAITFFVIWFLGFSFFLDFLFSLGYSDEFSQFMPFGMLVFLGMLVHAVTKYQMFNVKLIGAQTLVITTLALVGSLFFLVGEFLPRMVIGLTFFVVLLFGIMLVRSVKEEVKRKEELQKMANALATANERLQELDNAKSEFISIASHQLRTPLTAIKGYISLVLEGSYGKVSVEVQDVLQKVYSVQGRLTQLVEDLLNVSRIEAGRIKYQYEPTQLEPLVADLVDMFKLAAKTKGLSLDIRLPKHTLPKLFIDANKIKEVISNLIDNSLKYTEKGGTTVTVEQGDHKARIIISDTGVGFNPKDKDKLFQKFIRSKETTKMVTSGTGLGLYVGKNFVEAHGGAIFAESEGAGKGSRFIVELPFANPNATQGEIATFNESYEKKESKS